MQGTYLLHSVLLHRIIEHYFINLFITICTLYKKVNPFSYTESGNFLGEFSSCLDNLYLVS